MNRRFKMNNELIKEYKTVAYTIKVFGNRIEYSTKGGIFKKQEIVFFKNISSVNKPAMLNRVDIKTNDGKTLKLAVSTNPKVTEEFMNLILGMM
jgi:hypothetical protein